MLNTCECLAAIYIDLSMFFFKQSFLEICFEFGKWLHFYHTRSLDMSIQIFDQDHMKFHEFQRSSPTGSSLNLFFLENARVMISQTSGLFLTTQKNNVGSLLWSTSKSFLASSVLILSIFSFTTSDSSMFFSFIYLSFKDAWFIAFCTSSLSQFLISNSISLRFLPVIFR